MKKSRPQRILFSALTLFFYCATSVSAGLPKAYGENIIPLSEHQIEKQVFEISKFSLPAELGAIQEVYQGKSGKIVFYIQDAHASGAAQTSIFLITQKLVEDAQADHLFLEGSEGTLDLGFFKSYPDLKSLKDLFNGFVRSGELSGALAQAILHPREIKVAGIENLALYQEGIAHYLNAIEDQQPQLRRLLKIRKKIRAAQKKLLEQKDFEFYEDRDTLEKDLHYLPDFLKKWGSVQVIHAQQTPFLYQILNAERLAHSNPALFQKEISGLEKKLSLFITQESRAHYQARKQLFDTEQIRPGQFVLDLEELYRGSGQKLEISSELIALLEAERQMNRIQELDLKSELYGYFDRIKSGFVQSENVSRLDAFDEKLRLELKFLQFEIDRQEWDRLRSKLEAEKKNQAFVEFYENAKARENYFLKNMTGSRSVLVTGGFHVREICRRMKDKGISYVLIRPNFNPEKNSHYSQYMKGDVSWKSYYQSKNGWVDLYAAFARASRDQLLKRQGGLLKIWRDEMIRRYVRLNERSKIAKQVQFLDEVLNKNYANDKEILKTKWQHKIDRFIDSLEDLKTSNNFNQKSISQLLASFRTPAPTAIPFTRIPESLVFSRAELRAAPPADKWVGASKTARAVPDSDVPAPNNEAFNPENEAYVGNFGTALPERKEFFVRNAAARLLKVCELMLQIVAEQHQQPSVEDRAGLIEFIESNRAAQQYRDSVLGVLNYGREKNSPFSWSSIRNASRAQRLTPVQLQLLISFWGQMRSQLTPVMNLDSRDFLSRDVLEKNDENEFVLKARSTFRLMAFGWQHVFSHASDVGASAFDNQATFYSPLPHWVLRRHWGWRPRFESALAQSHLIASSGISLVQVLQQDSPLPLVHIAMSKPIKNEGGAEAKGMSFFILKKPLSSAFASPDYASFSSELDRNEMLGLLELDMPQRAARIFQLAKEGRLLFNQSYFLQADAVAAFVAHMTSNEYERAFLTHWLQSYSLGLDAQQLSSVQVSEADMRRVVDETSPDQIFVKLEASDEVDLLNNYPFGLNSEERSRVNVAQALVAAYLKADAVTQEVNRVTGGKDLGIHHFERMNDDALREFVRELVLAEDARRIIAAHFQKRTPKEGDYWLQETTTQAARLYLTREKYLPKDRAVVVQWAQVFLTHIVGQLESGLAAEAVDLEHGAFESFVSENIRSWRLWLLGWGRFPREISPPTAVVDDERAYFPIVPVFSMKLLGLEPQRLRPEAQAEFLASHIPTQVEYFPAVEGNTNPPFYRIHFARPIQVAHGYQYIDFHVVKGVFPAPDSQVWSIENPQAAWEAFNANFETNPDPELAWSFHHSLNQKLERIGKLLQLAREGKLLLHENYTLYNRGVNRIAGTLTRWPRRNTPDSAEERFEREYIEKYLRKLINREIPAASPQNTAAQLDLKIRSFHTLFHSVVPGEKTTAEDSQKIIARIEKWLAFQDTPILDELFPLAAATLVLKNDGTCCRISDSGFEKILAEIRRNWEPDSNVKAQTPGGKTPLAALIEQIQKSAVEIPETDHRTRILAQLQAVRFVLSVLQIRGGDIPNDNEWLEIFSKIFGFTPALVGQAFNYYRGEEALAAARSLYALAAVDTSLRPGTWEEGWKQPLGTNRVSALAAEAKVSQVSERRNAGWDLFSDLILIGLGRTIPRLQAAFDTSSAALTALDILAADSAAIQAALDSVDQALGRLQSVPNDIPAAAAAKLTWNDWDKRPYPSLVQAQRNVASEYSQKLQQTRTQLDALKAAYQAYRSDDDAEVVRVLENAAALEGPYHGMIHALLEHIRSRMSDRSARAREMAIAEFAKQTDRMHDRIEGIADPGIDGGVEAAYQNLRALLLGLREALQARSELRSFSPEGLNEADRTNMLRQVDGWLQELEEAYQVAKMNIRFKAVWKKFAEILEESPDKDHEAGLAPLRAELEELAASVNGLPEGRNKEEGKRNIKRWSEILPDFGEIRAARWQKNFDQFITPFASPYLKQQKQLKQLKYSELIPVLERIEAMLQEPSLRSVYETAVGIYVQREKERGITEDKIRGVFSALRNAPDQKPTDADKEIFIRLLGYLGFEINAVSQDIVHSVIPRDSSKIEDFLETLRDPEKFRTDYIRRWRRASIGHTLKYWNYSAVGKIFKRREGLGEYNIMDPVGYALSAHYAFQRVGMESFYSNGLNLAYLISQGGGLESVEVVEPYSGVGKTQALKLRFKKKLTDLDVNLPANEVVVFVNRESLPGVVSQNTDFETYENSFLTGDALQPWILPSGAPLADRLRVERQLLDLAQNRRVLVNSIYVVTEATREMFSEHVQLSAVTDQDLKEVEGMINQQMGIKRVPENRKTEEVARRKSEMDNLSGEEAKIEAILALRRNGHLPAAPSEKIRQRAKRLVAVKELIDLEPALGKFLLAEKSDGDCCVVNDIEFPLILTQLQREMSVNGTSVLRSRLASEVSSPKKLDFFIRSLRPSGNTKLRFAQMRETAANLFPQGEYARETNQLSAAQSYAFARPFFLNPNGQRDVLDSVLEPLGLSVGKIQSASPADLVWSLEADLLVALAAPQLLRSIQSQRIRVIAAVVDLSGDLGAVRDQVRAFQAMSDARSQIPASDQDLEKIYRNYFPSSKETFPLGADDKTVTREELEAVLQAREDYQAGRFIEAETKLPKIEENSPLMPAVGVIRNKARDEKKAAAEREQALQREREQAEVRQRELEATRDQRIAEIVQAADQMDLAALPETDTDLEELGELLGEGHELAGELERSRSKRALWRQIQTYSKQDVTESSDPNFDTVEIYTAFEPHSGKWPEDDLVLMQTDLRKVIDRKKNEKTRMTAQKKFDQAFSAFKAGNDETEAAVDEALKPVEIALAALEKTGANITENQMAVAVEKNSKKEAIRRKAREEAERKQIEREASLADRRQWVSSVLAFDINASRNILGWRSTGRRDERKPDTAGLMKRMKGLIAKAQEYDPNTDPVESEAEARRKIVDIQALLDEFQPQKAPAAIPVVAVPAPVAAAKDPLAELKAAVGALKATGLGDLIAAQVAALEARITELEASQQQVAPSTPTAAPQVVVPEPSVEVPVPPAPVAAPKPAGPEVLADQILADFSSQDFSSIEALYEAARSAKERISNLKSRGLKFNPYHDRINQLVEDKGLPIAKSWAQGILASTDFKVLSNMFRTSEPVQGKIRNLGEQADSFRRFASLDTQVSQVISEVDKLYSELEGFQRSVKIREVRESQRSDRAPSGGGNGAVVPAQEVYPGRDRNVSRPRRRNSGEAKHTHAYYAGKKRQFDEARDTASDRAAIDREIAGENVLAVKSAVEQLLEKMADKQDRFGRVPAVDQEAIDRGMSYLAEHKTELELAEMELAEQTDSPGEASENGELTERDQLAQALAEALATEDLQQISDAFMAFNRFFQDEAIRTTVTPYETELHARAWRLLEPFVVQEGPESAVENRPELRQFHLANLKIWTRLAAFLFLLAQPLTLDTREAAAQEIQSAGIEKTGRILTLVLNHQFETLSSSQEFGVDELSPGSFLGKEDWGKTEKEFARYLSGDLDHQLHFNFAASLSDVASWIPEFLTMYQNLKNEFGSARVQANIYLLASRSDLGDPANKNLVSKILSSGAVKVGEAGEANFEWNFANYLRDHANALSFGIEVPLALYEREVSVKGVRLKDISPALLPMIFRTAQVSAVNAALIRQLADIFPDGAVDFSNGHLTITASIRSILAQGEAVRLISTMA